MKHLKDFLTEGNLKSKPDSAVFTTEFQTKFGFDIDSGIVFDPNTVARLTFEIRGMSNFESEIDKHRKEKTKQMVDKGQAKDLKEATEKYNSMIMPIVSKYVDTLGREYERLEQSLNKVFKSQFNSLETNLIKDIRKRVKV